MKKRNLVAQKAKHKKKINLQDRKVRNIYNIFKNILFKNLENKPYAVGVSGGPDSLALAYLSKIYSKEFQSIFKIFIINHKLRKESTNEANKVKRILLKEKISSKILTWKGKIPKKNIQASARKIRYELLLRESNKYGIQNLILGHQNDDLIENFLIRLFRGSGLKGLSSFNESTALEHNNIKIIRPLISLKKNDLIYLSKKIFGTYILDPSNSKETYLRTRIRNYINTFKSEGLDINKINLTIENLKSAENSLNFYYKKSLKKYVLFSDKDQCIINTDLLMNESEETVFRVFGYVISKVGKNYYPPRGKDLMRLINNMRIKKNLKSTLGKCIIERINNTYIVKKEHKT